MPIVPQARALMDQERSQWEPWAAGPAWDGQPPRECGALWAEAQRGWSGAPRGVPGFCAVSGFLSQGSSASGRTRLHLLSAHQLAGPAGHGRAGPGVWPRSRAGEMPPLPPAPATPRGPGACQPRLACTDHVPGAAASRALPGIPRPRALRTGGARGSERSGRPTRTSRRWRSSCPQHAWPPPLGSWSPNLILLEQEPSRPGLCVRPLRRCALDRCRPCSRPRRQSRGVSAVSLGFASSFLSNLNVLRGLPVRRDEGLAPSPPPPPSPARL